MSIFDLNGRNAIVTGGSGGLGRSMAIGLADAGAQVVVVGRQQAELDAAIEEIHRRGGKAIAVTTDLLDPDGPQALVDSVVSRLGQIDVMLHAAGHQVRKPLTELPVDDWDGIANIHIRAAFLLARSAINSFREHQIDGKVIFVGSLNSHIGIANIGAYAAAKSGLLGLARVLSAENAAAGICINTIIPGYFHTALTDDLFADTAKRDWIMSRIPMKRLGKPDDLVGAAVFLASSASDYVTGAEIRVDGGWLAT